MTPRRVLMTADAVGGVWEYALELCRGLGERGIAVVLAVMGPPPDGPQRAAAEEVRGLELAEAPYRLEWMEDPWADVAAAGDWLLELERRHDCDLVHLDGYAHAVVPFRSPKLVVAHSCVLSWWRAVKGGAAPPAWDAYRRAVGAGLAAADGVVAPTSAMLGMLQREHGPLRGAEVIPNGRRPDDYGSGPRETFVLGAGRLWDEGKNLALLARVAPRLPWPVWIAGAATADREAPQPTAANTRFLGKLPGRALAALLARTPIFVSTALYEPFGLTVLEAALSGCALVLSDLPSFRELWLGAAVFVRAGDEEELAAALVTLAAAPARREVLGARACRRAHDFGSARMVDRYLGTYGRLIGARAARQEGTCAS